MTVPKKLFIAAVILSIGFGLAVLCGLPPDPLLSTGTFSGSGQSVGVYDPVGTPADAVTSPSFIGSERLVPDTVDKLEAPVSEKQSNESPHTAPHLQAHLVATGMSSPQLNGYVESRPQVSPPPQVSDQSATGPAVATVVYPRAVSTAPPNEVELDQQKTLSLPPPPVLQASFDSPGRTETSPSPAMSAAWTNSPVVAVPRTHIVVDGDSLPRLAERYLGDPLRGEEIFALNQGVLTHPDLLPIGAELKIPPRPLRIETWSDWHGEQGNAALASGLVPVYEIPSAASVAPRAHLLKPMSPPAASTGYQNRITD